MMRVKRYVGLLGAALLLMAGCGMLPGATGSGAEGGAASDAEEAVEDQPTDIESDVSVMAEAVVEPAQWTSLGFKGQGEVIEVQVEPGDVVSEGDLLVVLDSTDARLGVRRAEAAVENARAQVAIMRAGARPEEISAIEAQLEAAEAALAEAAARRDDLAGGSNAADVADAEAQVAAIALQRQTALDDYETALNATCKNVSSGGGFLNIGGLNIGGLGGLGGLGGGGTQKACPDEDAPEQARLALVAADSQLAAAQAQLDLVRAGADPDLLRAALAGVSSASAQRDANQAQLDLALAGPSPEQLAIAEAGVIQAEAALDKAKAALSFTEVRAPFAGTVVAVESDVGNMAVPGQVAVVLATLDRLQVRTTDLSELDVSHVAVGEEVIVTVDPLPGTEFTGIVSHVDLQAENARGEVTYGVVVELADVSGAPLRWGMTAWVEFGAL
jgi:multidrug efflux pump subunit AcrA (membrane-fusion protein)